MKANELYLPELPLERFSFKNGVLSAFESDLRDHTFDGHYRWLGRLWNDSCDEGCRVRSHRTGNVESFYLERTETRDGDLLAWHLKPCDPELVEKIKELVIFND